MMNTVTISTTLAIAITCMIIGFVTGGFIGYRNKDSKKKTPEGAVEPAHTPSQQTPAPLADPAKYTELLRLWRNKENNGLFVETSGHLLGSSEPLNSAQKSRFIDLMKELAGWLNTPLREIMGSDTEIINPPSKPLPPVEAQPVEAVSSEPAIPAAVVKASEPIKTDPLPVPLPVPPVPATASPAIEVQSPNPPVVSRIPSQPVIRPAVEQTKKTPTSMVEQIDEILQEIIQNSDDPTRIIKLTEEKQDGVIVWIGHERFIGIDTVTDQSAIALIRAAVKEWDRRTENRG
jgi:hypothetical protein